MLSTNSVSVLYLYCLDLFTCLARFCLELLCSMYKWCVFHDHRNISYDFDHVHD